MLTEENKKTKTKSKSSSKDDSKTKTVVVKKKAAKVSSIEDLLNAKVSSAKIFSKVLNELIAHKDRPALFFSKKIAGYDCPAEFSNIHTYKTFFGGEMCSILCRQNFVDIKSQNYISVGDDAFFNEQTDKKQSFSVKDVLKNFLGVSIFTKEEATKMRQDLQKCFEITNEKSRVFDVAEHSVDAFYGFFGYSFKRNDLYKPMMVVSESVLEVETYDYRKTYITDPASSPFVRLFSFQSKTFTYAHISELRDHTWRSSQSEKICLDSDMKHVLDCVFSSKEETFGDIFNDRHGGLIILANGTPGVGKTLTAEVYSEQIKKPLYVLEMGEIGTNVESVEAQLKTIFERAAKWDAVLLFDEADIFLTKRSEDDLERSAIVGIFLRMLDKYSGIFFLTTNRADVIDDAFKSRITLKLEYTPLDAEKRISIWTSMLAAAKINVKSEDIKELGKHEVNGRQIRNHTRLLSKIFCGRESVSLEEIEGTLKFLSR